MENNFILCIETATETCSVALSKSGKCIAEKNVHEQNAHGTQLTVLIENLMAENHLSWKDLSAIAYSHGPGSYTGLRIGLSVAKGICYGSGLPLIEVPTLQHMANRAKEHIKEGQLFFPMIDARRMEVYAALIDHEMKFVLEPFPCLVEEYDWAGLLSDKKIFFFGNGLSKSKEILKKYPNACFVDDFQMSADSMCSLADARFNNDQLANLAYHVPFYLKEANVTEAKKKLL